MSDKILKAALNASRLAEEAKKKSYLDLERAIQGTKATVLQAKHDQLKKRWQPPGYIFGLELLDLTGKAKFGRAWIGQEMEMELNPPPYRDIPTTIDPENVSSLISYGLLNKHVKENRYKSISSKRLKPWQNEFDWLYRLHSGEYWGANTKDKAIDAWLKIAAKAIVHARQYEAAIDRLNQVKRLLRDALYADHIKAVRLDKLKNILVHIPNSFWLNDACMVVFSLETPTDNILFEQSLIETFLNDPQSSKKEAQSQDMKVLKKIYDIRSSIIGDSLNGPRIKADDQTEYQRQYELFSQHHVALASALKEAGFSIAEYGDIERLGVLTDRPILATSNFDDHIKRMAATILERLAKVLEVHVESPLTRKPPEETDKKNSNQGSAEATNNKKTRTTPFHEDIGRAFQKLKKEMAQKPSAHHILREMKKNQTEYPFFLKEDKNSQRETVIHYRHASGNNSTMRKKSFDDIVSRISTRKKPL